ncbi:SDR family NAD(P)-dependent oxidoreductase [Rubellimicrobium aerolatum]|uniref:SDR family NAD(P)-dependent oxidoreductase n=1 Tax=Rubellimicrobium aerolatum TaxID=490979 RepID=A0ABW0S7W4_9RHOB|nr:SDR family oxidoreductase [Rubellimicrobium aerolatum]MBP1804446.1 NAD(P)-dependent dehydrogenase (short-subunit alcohol dehydrogenase family) [Rubellimicrobium aerolatum]
MDLGLKGKVAVVTGGSVGIGLGVARAFAREGADVLIAARDGARAEESARTLGGEFPVRVVAQACDVATAEGCAALIDAARREFGGCDVLVNNAGTGSNETILEAADDKWQAYWDLHVMAAVRLARGLAPLIAQRGGGAILNNASICATQPLWYEPIYNTTKAALVMLSKCMATEFIPMNVRVNTVSPGLILTPDWVKTARQLSEPTGGDWQGYLQGVADEHAAIKRFGTVEELADFMVFLCSPRAAYAVGGNYFYDGGMLRTI